MDADVNRIESHIVLARACHATPLLCSTLQRTCLLESFKGGEEPADFVPESHSQPRIRRDVGWKGRISVRGEQRDETP